MGSVLQDWVLEIPLMQQTVLMTAVRGPDGIGKYHPVKYLLRWYRRCFLIAALEGCVLDRPGIQLGGSFTGPSCEFDSSVWHEDMQKWLDKYLKELDGVPHHFQMHFMHGAEILGYKHPEEYTKDWWNHTYETLVNDMHLNVESMADMDYRLGDSHKQWSDRNNKATQE